jgi:hypothetical protein
MTDPRENTTSPTSASLATSRPDADHHEASRLDTSSVPCVYCMAAIPSGTFVYWTHATRLLSADCPECTRRTTLAVKGIGPLPLPAERGTAVRATPDPAGATTAHGPMASTCACGHGASQHDAIASRYCDATLAGVLPRGCICLRAVTPSA